MIRLERRRERLPAALGSGVRLLAMFRQLANTTVEALHVLPAGKRAGLRSILRGHGGTMLRGRRAVTSGGPASKPRGILRRSLQAWRLVTLGSKGRRTSDALGGVVTFPAVGAACAQFISG